MFLNLVFYLLILLFSSHPTCFHTDDFLFLILIINYTAVTFTLHRGADKSLARPTSLCILFDDQNISYDDSLLRYINRTNIPPIIIINRIYETQDLLSL